jgi:hypothetical protein
MSKNIRQWETQIDNHHPAVAVVEVYRKTKLSNVFVTLKDERDRRITDELYQGMHYVLYALTVGSNRWSATWSESSVQIFRLESKYAEAVAVGLAEALTLRWSLTWRPGGPRDTWLAAARMKEQQGGKGHE